MTKLDLISILKLLSALESWGFAQGVRVPDYLHEQLSGALELIEVEILKEAPRMEQLTADLATYGLSITCDGGRIDPRDVVVPFEFKKADDSEGGIP